MFAALLSSFCLFASQASDLPADSSIDIIRRHHLETSEGRETFLTQELAPYAIAANELNTEISEVSNQIQGLSPTDDKEEIVSLSEYVTQCMDLMSWMLPSLELAKQVDTDLAQLDDILSHEEELSPEQLEVLDRVATLCLYIDSYNAE